MELNDRIRNYIVENFLFGDQGTLKGDEQSLLDSGIIDSVGVMELVSYLESEHGLQIQDEELMPENLDSIAYLALAHPEELGNGRLWHDRRPRSVHKVPWTRPEAGEADKLWERVCADAGIEPSV